VTVEIQKLDKKAFKYLIEAFMVGEPQD